MKNIILLIFILLGLIVWMFGYVGSHGNLDLRANHAEDWVYWGGFCVSLFCLFRLILNFIGKLK